MWSQKVQSDQIAEQLREKYDKDSDYFELLSSWYSSGKFKRRTIPMIQKLKPYLQKDTIVLDAGCAAGAMSIELANTDVQRVDAADFSSVALQFARNNAIKYGLEGKIQFIESKLEQLAQVDDNTYDVVVAADIIEHIVVPSVFIREMWRVCKPGGIILIETPNTLFRQHPWYPKIEALCRRLHLPESRNLFPGSSKHDWGDYHVSLLKWTELVQLLQKDNWQIVEESAFGWWIQHGAADSIMHWLGNFDNLFGTKMRYYGSSDVLIIARKPK
jgi:2-polyprenyl-3-methyl-5-hydroxy-6-metoxy-1,4-benzoquinol methylase